MSTVDQTLWRLGGHPRLSFPHPHPLDGPFGGWVSFRSKDETRTVDRNPKDAFPFRRYKEKDQETLPWVPPSTVRRILSPPRSTERHVASNHPGCSPTSPSLDHPYESEERYTHPNAAHRKARLSIRHVETKRYEIQWMPDTSEPSTNAMHVKTDVTRDGTSMLTPRCGKRQNDHSKQECPEGRTQSTTSTSPIHRDTSLSLLPPRGESKFEMWESIHPNHREC